MTPKSDQLRDIFRSLDKSADKFLSRDEIKAGFSRLGAHCPGWRAFWGLRCADANKDGLIDVDEFEELVNYALKIGYTVK